MGRTRNIGVAAALGTAVSILSAGVASAAPLDHGTFHETFSEVVEDFCDVPGLDVQVEGVDDGSFLGRAQGRDGLSYFMFHVRTSAVLTNLANGQTITDTSRVVQKDLHIVDNGDGTLTITVLATGAANLFGTDGKAIARNPGQIRFQVVVDHNGTPTDPSDDEELEFSVIKESTGRSDDYCAAAVDALT